jgi:hypothetical protein
VGRAWALAQLIDDLTVTLMLFGANGGDQAG